MTDSLCRKRKSADSFVPCVIAYHDNNIENRKRRRSYNLIKSVLMCSVVYFMGVIVLVGLIYCFKC